MTEERWAGDRLGNDDLAIPEIKLIQKTGGDIAKGAGAVPGQFYSELTDETFESFELVVASMQSTRTYWGRSEIDEEPPECSSTDMVEGFLGKCASCEHRNDQPWLLKAEERRTKCLVNYNIVGLNLTNGLPMLLRASGLSSGAAKALYTQLKLHPMIQGDWSKAKTVVSSQPRKTPYGDVFAIKFGKLELVLDKDLSFVRTRVGQLIGKTLELLPVGETPVGEQIAEASKEPYGEQIDKTLAAAKAKPGTVAPKKIDTDF